MKRRKFLLFSSVATSSLLTGCMPMMLAGMMRKTRGNNIPLNPNNISTSYNHSFNQDLAIPELLDGENIDGIYHYNLTVQKAKHPFFQNKLTNTYAVNGTYLAPTLRLINGQNISINYTNSLDETTTMHGHGMHLPANMDGTAHQTISAGGKWSARYTVNQRACTNWYHPHAEGKTAEQVYKGLAGLIIIEDSESQSLDLPKNYGIDDIPLVLQDRFFDENRQLLYAPNMMQVMMGYKGDTFVTNGVLNPYINVENKEIRLRLLNGSNSTVYNLKFSDNREFSQIATDNSFLEKPVAMTHLRLSPGERAEIVVDFSNAFGQEVYLEEYGQQKAFLKLKVSKTATATTSMPEVLTTLTKYSPSDSVNLRKFTLSGMMGRVLINNKTMDMQRVDEVVPLNQIEIWEINNEKMMMMGMEHNFHIHGTHFMVIERNGSNSNVAENEKGYKDTVYLAPGDSVKVIVKMTDYKDSQSPYMYHCHFLEHEDRGMMGQFIVV